MTLRHHSPPPVRMHVAPGWLLGAAAAVVALAGLSAWVYWCVFSAAAGWLRGAGVGLWLATAVLVLREWRHLPMGVLRWDGQSWSWRPQGLGGEEGEQDFVALTTLQVVFDVQFALGLRCTIGARRYFFWLQRSANSACWEAVRRAVYSSALIAPPQAVP